MMRRVAMGAVAAVAVASWFLTVGAGATSQQAWSHLVEEGEGGALAARLDAAARDGWELAAVVRPDPGPLPRVPMVVLARADGAAPQNAEHAVVAAPDVRAFEDDLNEWAFEGFELRGVSWTAPRLSGGVRLYQAVLERSSASASMERAYRVVRTTGQAGEWRQLEQAGREGFRVAHVLWFPDPLQSAAGEVVFVAERAGPAALPLEYDTLFDSTDNNLTKKVNQKSKAGYEVVALWTSRDYANVLLARPRELARRQPAEFAFDEDPGSPSIGVAAGRFIDMLARGDRFLVAYDKRGKGVYATVDEQVIDEADRFRSHPFDPDLAVRALNRHGRDGFRAFAAATRPNDSGQFRLRVHLQRE
jgi:hypothetical protein